MSLSVSSIVGTIRTGMKGTLLLIRVRLSFWWKNTAVRLFLAVLRFEYWDQTVRAMYALRKRWMMLLDRFPARRHLREWQEAYGYLYEEWQKLDHDYKDLYAKHMDMMEELRYWETRHSKVLNYIEKHMEGDK